MNKTAIKHFAVNARTALLEAVKQRAAAFAVTEAGSKKSISDRSLSPAEAEQRRQLIDKIQKDGFSQTMEEAAYAWFHRFTALRFMEVNGYLESRLFSDRNGAFKPELLAQTLHTELDGQDRNARYKYLLMAHCNALHQSLPEVFEEIGGWTELLLPDGLLRQGSILAHMVEDIPEEDWAEQVQIIGWLYQYYNTEPKNRVFSDLKKNIKISAENLPAATQLFTPDWIVRYMVDNSLGKLWLEAHPDSPVRASLQYYISGNTTDRRSIAPESIRFIDPCMGSGHILVYAFDVLMQIYTSCGWTQREAAKSILTHNLYGLDIDRRAYRLAYFALLMKAGQYSRSILNSGIKLHLANFQDTAGVNTAVLSEPLKSFAEQFEFADTYGSLMELTAPEGIEEAAPCCEIQMEMMRRSCRILSQKYDVVVTNPPYMSSLNMNDTLLTFLKKQFPVYKSDLFSAFVVRCTRLARDEGYLGFLTPYVWMFIQSYERLRRFLYDSKTIASLIQFEYSAFEEATVPICAFILRNSFVNQNGCYIRLTDFKGGMEVQKQKALEAIANADCGFFYKANASQFSSIPGAPAVYWASEQFLRAFDSPKLGEISLPRQGLITGDNDRFLRLWFEVDVTKTALEYDPSKKWFPLNKGGAFRRWYGNHAYVVNWEHDGAEIRSFQDKDGKLRSRPQNLSYNFRPALSWSLVTSGGFSARLYDERFMCNVAGICIFPEPEVRLYLLGLLNSKIVSVTAAMLNPTMNMNAGDIARLPVMLPDAHKQLVEETVTENIALSKQDWDSFETSWGFRKHPLIRSTASIAKAYALWEQECSERFHRLKANEETLNRIFIRVYGLQNELHPEVGDKAVTIRKADLQREIKSLLSYAVGCIFGRYSVDHEGLCYAGGEWDSSKFQTIIPVEDNVLPVCDDAYFEDDLTTRIIDFVRKIYGEETLEENLKYIADALGGRGTPREVIRSYMANGFFADHCKLYQKRPVYWTLCSGKQNSFKALVYMHRWRKDTLERAHTLLKHYYTQLQTLSGQLKKQQKKLQAQFTELTVYAEKLRQAADGMPDIDLDDGVRENYAKFADILEKIK